MPAVVCEGEQYKTVIPVSVTPTSHSMPSCHGHLLGSASDIYHFGAEIASYPLNHTDTIYIIASHKRPKPQIILSTEDNTLIAKLPGKRPNSLVAQSVIAIDHYLSLCAHYPKPLTNWQLKKQTIASSLIQQLKGLYEQERNISPEDLESREQFRNQLIQLIEKAKDDNYRVANHPFASSGELGRILYQCKYNIECFEFNPFIRITKEDQGLFQNKSGTKYIWDSKTHMTGTAYDIHDCLRAIAKHYQLDTGESFVVANRFERLKQNLETSLHDAKDLADYCLIPNKPQQQLYEQASTTVGKTFVEPYYTFQTPKLTQTIEALNASNLDRVVDEAGAKMYFNTHPKAQHCLNQNGTRIFCNPDDKQFTIDSYRCYIIDDTIKLLPNLSDLSAVMHASERHLYWPERAWIHFNLFFNHIPVWFNWVGHQTKRIAIEEVYNHIVEQVHRGHQAEQNPALNKNKPLTSVAQEIEKHLPNGQSFDEWMKQYISEHKYVFPSSGTQANPPLYHNPIHRFIHIGEHVGAFFVRCNELHPTLGTIALSAYIFGAMSIVAPEAFASVLTTLHLHGLSHLIPIVQKIGEVMSHSTASQTLSAAITLWQGTMLTGQLDQVIITGLSTAKKKPSEVIIVPILAMSLGYVLCNGVPFIKNEMGQFPYTTYAAAGTKGGAAIFDMVMHPGDDWLLGSIKWILSGFRFIGSLIVAPVIEGFYYGWHDGFLYGLSKSYDAAIQMAKQVLAALLDSGILLGMFFLRHGSSLFLHVPFRGITQLLSKLIAVIGHLRTIGLALIQFSHNQFDPVSSFRTSPFYGFNNPIDQYHQNPLINIAINSCMVITYPPLFLLKDFFILPLTDMASYMVRVSLMIMNEVCKIISLLCGYTLLALSVVIDPTIGWLCLEIADKITVSANFIDRQAGQLKRQALSQGQVMRGQLYRWAFSEEGTENKKQENCSPINPFIIDQIDAEMPVSAML